MGEQRRSVELGGGGQETGRGDVGITGGEGRRRVQIMR